MRHAKPSALPRPKHSLGQNFILDENLQDELAGLTDVSSQDTVVEIGAGTGLLTKALAKRAGRVTALEIDRDLIPGLRAARITLPNVQVLNEDALRFDFRRFAAENGPFRIAANLPYHITTALLTRLMREDLPIRSIHLMLQKESAEKFLSGPRDDGYGVLPLRVQWRYDPSILRVLPPEVFTPPPKVESAFLALVRRDGPPAAADDEAFLFRVVNAAFAARRKTVLNNLLSAFPLTRESAQALLDGAAIPENARAEELDIRAFAGLADMLKRACSPGPGHQ